MSRIWWPEFLLSHCFLLVTRLQQFLTQQVQGFRLAVPMRLQRTDGTATMSMRSTRGWSTGSLGVASPPGRPDHQGDLRKEGCCEQCTAQACSRDSTTSQGGFSLIPSTRCCMIVLRVCTRIYQYVRVYTSI